MLLQQCRMTGPKCHLLLISIPMPDTRYLLSIPYQVFLMLLQQSCITGPKCHLLPISIPIPDTRCRYLIRFSLCYYSNAVSMDLNAICSWYRYRYPLSIPCQMFLFPFFNLLMWIVFLLLFFTAPKEWFFLLLYTLPLLDQRRNFSRLGWKQGSPHLGRLWEKKKE